MAISAVRLTREQKIERPLSVSALASLQLGKAWILLMVALVAWVVPDAVKAFGSVLSVVVYVASHGRNARGLMLPIVGVYMAVIGIALWNLQGWSRKSLVTTSAVTIVLWGRALMIGSILGETLAQRQFETEGVFTLLALDAITFFYLSFDSDAKRAFGVKE